MALGHRRGVVKQHGSSTPRDPYVNFRNVPQFHTAALQHQDKVNSSNVLKHWELLKRIAGNNPDYGNN